MRVRKIPVLIAVGVLAGAGLIVYLLRTSASPPTRATVGPPSSGPGATPPPGPNITEIIQVSSPVGQGSVATIRALAHPGSTCTLTATDEQGSSVKTGTGTMRAGPQGAVGWAWHLDPQVSPGSYRLVVACQPGTTSTSTLIVN